MFDRESSSTPGMALVNPAPPTAGTPHDPEVFRVGTLAYTKGGLRRLFFWLLTADVVFAFIDQIEPKLLPIILKQYEASDRDIALIVSSTAALMQFLVTPVLSYRSDRKRGPRGRRIPYLLWATPFASLMLAATPFAPELAARFFPDVDASSWLSFLPSQPAVFAFALLALGYRFFHAIISAMFFSLFRDVVPSSHMGRFLALFRMFGAAATFLVTYWLVGHAETRAKPIFIGVALFNLVGFWVLCRFVREGDYPPVEEETRGSPGWRRLPAAVRTFVRQSYRHPVYWWTYGARLLIYAAVPTAGFIVFFPHRELGLPWDQVGRLMSWAAIVWLAAAYPVGRAIDRWGARKVLGASLVALTVGYALSFFAVTGVASFFISSLVTGVLYWAVMLGQIALAQEIFNRDRYAQLSSANVLIQSLAIAFLISPATGATLDALRGIDVRMMVPLIGEVAVGPYRFVNLMLALMYGTAGFCVYKVHRHWSRLGGARGDYQAPL